MRALGRLMPTHETQYDPVSDYYAALGVWPHADPADILHAYRAAVKKHHPDAGGDPSGQMIRVINRAYAVLRDPVKRSYYDRSRHQYGLPPISSAGRPRRRRRRRRSLVRRFAAVAAAVVFIVLGALLLAVAVAGVKQGALGRAADRDRPDARRRSHEADQTPRAAASFGYATPFEPTGTPTN